MVQCILAHLLELSILGGEIKQYVKMMEDSRDESINRCIDHAKELGANAIVTVRMDSDSISQNMLLRPAPMSPPIPLARTVKP